MSNEFLGERRRGLEEAYFAKHNRELIARRAHGVGMPRLRRMPICLCPGQRSPCRHRP
jgi:hypothetical protein